MKTVRLSLIATLILVGCGPYKAFYDIRLINVGGPEDIKSGESKIWFEMVDESNGSRYEDDNFLMDFLILSNGIIFIIKNKTDNPVKIIRAGTYYIDQNGKKHRAISQYADFEKRHEPEEPFLLNAHYDFSDSFFPVDYIIGPGKYGLRCRPYLPSIKRDRKQLRRAAESLVGKNLGFILTLEADGVEMVYTFTFEIKDANIMTLK